MHYILKRVVFNELHLPECRMSDIILLDGDEDPGFIISDVKSLAEEVPLAEYSDGQISERRASNKQETHGMQDIPMIDLESESEDAVSESSLTPSNKAAPVVTKDSNVAKGTNDVLSSGDIIPEYDLFPDIQQCLANWKTIFPWVNFIVKEKKFTCRICQWGYPYPEYYEVFQLVKQGDKLTVAGKLRSHSNRKFHIIAAKEEEFTLKLCQSIFSTVKYGFFTLKSMEVFQRNLAISLPSNVPESKPFISLALHNLAEIIEEAHLASLRKSRFFSIVALGDCEFLILRWLNSQSEVVEHLFCSEIQKNKEKLPVLAYLQFIGIDMKCMVSFSDLKNTPRDFMKSAAQAVNIAERYCSIDILLEWLKHSEDLKELLLHLKLIHKICHMPNVKVLPEKLGTVFADVSESDVHRVLKEDGALDVIFHHTVYLHEVLKTLPFQNKQINFVELGSKRQTPLFQVLYLLPALRAILEDENSPDFIRKLKDFRITLDKVYPQKVNTEDFFVKSVIDMFVLHAIMIKETQGSTFFPCLDILVQRLSDISANDIKVIFQALMPQLDCSVGCKHVFDLCGQSVKSRDSSLLSIIANLQYDESNRKKFPLIYELGQMIMVLPTLNAHVERNFFEVSAGKAILEGKIPQDLISLLIYLYIEGPPSFRALKKEKILKLFCGK